MDSLRDRATGLPRNLDDFELPSTLVALERLDGDRFAVDLTEQIERAGWDPTQDRAFVRPDYDPEFGEALDIQRVPPSEASDNPLEETQVRKVDRYDRDGERRSRIILEPRHVETFDFDTDRYDGSDPFIFEVMVGPDGEHIMLDPVGNLSGFVWPNAEITFPREEAVISSVAEEAQVDRDELVEWLDRIAASVVAPTFYTFGLELDERVPEVLSVDGQRVALYTAPRNEETTTLLELLHRLFGLEPPLLNAVWDVHQTVAKNIVAEANDGQIPADHPVADEWTDAILIPLDSPESAALPSGAGGVARQTISPVTEQAVTAVAPGVEPTPREIHGWITEFATEVDNDDVASASGQTERSSITIAYQPPSEIPPQYDRVRVHFVSEGTAEELSEQAGINPELAAAGQRAHDEQAERILFQIPGIPKRYKQFRADCHALIVPVTDTETPDDQNAESDSTTDGDTNADDDGDGDGDGGAEPDDDRAAGATGSDSTSDESEQQTLAQAVEDQ